MRTFKKVILTFVIVLTIFLNDTSLFLYAQDIGIEETGGEQDYISAQSNESVKISYMAHVQKNGWLECVANGESVGTTGSSLRMEALKINVSNIRGYSGDVLYRSHVQTYGWESSWRKNNEMSGTVGQSKRLEAVQIKLTGELRKRYNVYYRVHVQTYGWLDWAKNGSVAGTTGYSKRIEAIEITLVDKGNSAPGAEGFSHIDSGIGVSYTTHVQTYGWQGAQTNGFTAGTEGQSKRLECVQIKLLNCPYKGDIEYQSHVQTYGWETDWKSNGQSSGTEGQSKRLEAIRIRLTGELSEKCDVYYRVHSQHFGWLGWVKNGEAAGTSGFAYRMEGIQILLLPKEARTFSDEVGYVTKENSSSTPQWKVSDIITRFSGTECAVNTPVELLTEPVGIVNNSVQCHYTWVNNTTGETGDIGVVKLGSSIYWTPELSGDYTVTMTARNQQSEEISKQIGIEVNHGEIKKEDAFFTAHMGLSSQAPSNSIPAYILAGTYGFDSIEADVNETSDGVFILSHDNNLINICGIDKNISELTYAEIKDYNMYHITAGVNVNRYSSYELRLPTLEEYIDICLKYGCIPQLDIKNLSSFDSVLSLYDILTSYGIENRVIITSFDNLYLQSLRELDSNLTLTYGVSTAEYLDLNWLENDSIGVSVQYSNLLTGGYDMYLERNIGMNAYTVNDKKTAGILLERGLDSITTNYVLWE